MPAAMPPARDSCGTGTRQRPTRPPPATADGGDRLDPPQITVHRLVAGKHQMIAVVDGLIQRRIVIRAAAATGLPRRFIKRDGNALLGQSRGRGQARNAGADHEGAAAFSSFVLKRGHA